MVMDSTIRQPGTEPGAVEPPAHDAVSRPAVILQVLPALVTGGVERGTLDVDGKMVDIPHLKAAQKTLASL